MVGEDKKGVGLQRSYFDVLGICCASEISLIENILKPIEGVKEVTVIVTTRTVIVVHDNLLVSQSQIVKALNQARLEANVRAYGEHKNHRKKWPSPYALGSGFLLIISLFKFVNPIFQWVALGSVAVGIWPIAFKSFAAIRHFRIDINILALIAVIGTIAMKDYLEAATIVFLFTIAEWLESRASHKANAVMSSLLSIAPQKAVLADSGEVVATDEVKLGSLLAVKPGEVIPIDGIVVEGKCEVDEKTLTGESFPVAKQNNSSVWAGTINLNGYVTVKTTALAQDCVVAKMAKLVEDAQSNKSRVQRFIDKCAKYYTPAVLILSTCIAVIPAALRLHNRKFWFHLALVVLVSACPCALILSTPVATFCALTKAATSGLLIKGGDYLEILAKIKVMAFDKTGTITRGEFTVTEFQALDQKNISLNTLLYWISSIESKSSHPMATALVDHGRSLSIDPKPENVDDFQNFPGEGVHGKIDGKDIYIGNRKIALRANCTTVPEIKDDAKDGRTVGYIFCGATPAGIFSLSDTCRTGAKEAMEELRSLGIKTAMLTGDCSASALQAQKELGKALQIVHAELLPEDKTRLINDFKKEGRTAMIGDGLNDAPALATADIGISMGISGSALAIETGNVILMSNDIRKIPKVIQLARRARRKVIENVILALTPRIAILGLAFAGHPLVWAAVLADVGTCVLVILNSMLLLRGADKHRGKAGKFSPTQCAYKRQHSLVNLESTGNGNQSSEDCCSHKKTEKIFLSQNCASNCCSRPTDSSLCKKIMSVESTSKQDDSACCVQLNEGGCCNNNSQSAQHNREAHSLSTDHQVKGNCCSQKNIQESSLPQKCVSKCQSKSSISSSCEKIRCTKSTLMLDGSAGSVELRESGCCTRSSHSVQPDHHIIQITDPNASNSYSSSSNNHIRNDCCSQENTQIVSLPQSKCRSKSCNSSSCGKLKCGDSTMKQDECPSSLELQDQTHCNLGRFDPSNFDFESQENLNSNVSSCTKDKCGKRIGEGAKADECQELLCNATCCEVNGGSNKDDVEHHLNLPQSKCRSKTCNSSSGGKIKSGDSIVRQDDYKGSLELQDMESQEKCAGPCRAVNVCMEDKCKVAKICESAKANGCQEVKPPLCNATCCQKKGGLNIDGSEDRLNLPQSKCQSKTCKSSSCGKFKLGDSTVRQNKITGSMEIQDQKHCNLGRFDTSDFDLELQEKLNSNVSLLYIEDKCSDKVAKIGQCAKADICQEVKPRFCNATCCKKNGVSNTLLQNEVVHPDVKVCNGDFGAALDTTINIKLGAGHPNSEPADSYEVVTKRETNSGCKGCKKECSELKITPSCASLEKREMGGCCKSYMKECCRKKHGDMGTTVGGGLNEIIID